MDLRRWGQRAFTGLHTRIYRVSGGRLGRRLGKVEAVLLTTTGRKTGRTRTTPLTAVPDGDRIVLLASNGGAPRHPDWYLNLTANPEVVIQRGPHRLTMLARTATPRERPALWASAVAIYGSYDSYQGKADREIPVIICEPSPPPEPPRTA